MLVNNQDTVASRHQRHLIQTYKITLDVARDKSILS